MPNRSEAPPLQIFWNIIDTLDIYNNPLDLLHAVYFVIGVGFCFRGRQDHEHFDTKEIRLVVDEAGNRSYDVNPHFFKNNQDDVGLNMRAQRLAVRQIHEINRDDPKDPFRIIQEYLGHLPRNYKGPFYLHPFTDKQIKSNYVIGNNGASAWYNPKLKVGKNTLSAILKYVYLSLKMLQVLL